MTGSPGVPPVGPVLVTGCSTGIGRALALELHARGHAVVATARRVGTLDALGRAGIRIAPLDVADPGSIEALAGALAATGTAPRMVVNNAGYGSFGPITEIAEAELRRQFDVNLFGAIAVARRFLPGMIAAGHGRIVNVGSIVGLLVSPFGGAYCATKFALRAATDAMRLELAPFGIRVVEVRPGAIASAFAGNAADAAARAVPEGSPFAPYRDRVVARAAASQSGRTMSTERFARLVCDRVLRDRPPAVVTGGPYSRLVPFLADWVPTPIRDPLLRRRFGMGPEPRRPG